MRFAVLLATTVVLVTLGRAAHADIYAFTDAAGVTHYSNVPADGRFEVLLREERPAREGASLPGSWRDRAPQFDALVEQAARTHRVDPALLRAVIAVESAFQPQAVSPKGAQGLMQLLPATAERYGARDPFDPAQNIDAGARHLRSLLTRYGDTGLALAAYNAGEAAVERFGRRVPPFPETRAYVPAVLAIYRQLSTALSRGPDGAST